MKGKVLIKILLNFVLITPLLGLMSIYIYALLAMIGLRTTSIYLTDPKSVPLGELYDVFRVLPLFGILGILLGVPVLLYVAASLQKPLVSKKAVIAYFCGTFLMVFLYFFDLGYYQFWFFD